MTENYRFSPACRLQVVMESTYRTEATVGPTTQFTSKSPTTRST